MPPKSKTKKKQTKVAPQVKTNPRGIPEAPFVENVEEHIGGPDVEVESSLRQFQEAIAKYKYMEISLSKKRRSLEEKIPDITKTVDMIKFLQSRKQTSQRNEDEGDLDDLGDQPPSSGPLTTTFELNDTLYAHAELEDTDTVYIWLGANTMLSYATTEAIEMLSARLSSAEQTLKNTIEDLEFLREQVTVMEVNTARVYNWDVKRRRLKRESQAVPSAES